PVPLPRPAGARRGRGTAVPRARAVVVVGVDLRGAHGRGPCPLPLRRRPALTCTARLPGRYGARLRPVLPWRGRQEDTVATASVSSRDIHLLGDILGLAQQHRREPAVELAFQVLDRLERLLGC